METKATLVCPFCQTANRSADRICSKCGQSLAAARTNFYLDQAEKDITIGQYNHARASLTKADVEMLTIPTEQRKGLLLTARAFYLHSLIYYNKGQIEEAREEMIFAQQNLEGQPGGEVLFANVLNGLGNIEYYREHLDAAMEYYRRSSEVALRSGAHSIAAKAIANLANISTAQGNPAASLTIYQSALGEAQRAADPLRIAEIYRLIAEVYLKDGPVSKAIEYSEKALSLAAEIEDTAALCRIISDAGNVYLTCGELDKAESCLNRAYNIAQRTEYRLMQVVNLMYLANLMRQRGDDEGWLNFATRAFNLSGATVIWRAEAALHLVEYYVSHQDWDSAQRYLQYIEDAVRLNAFEGNRIHLYHARALLHAANDEWNPAIENYEMAITALHNNHDLIGAAGLQWEYAVMLLRRANLERDAATHAQARALLAEAAATYRRVGLNHRVAPIEALLNHQEYNLLNRLKNIRQPHISLTTPVCRSAKPENPLSPP